MRLRGTMIGGAGLELDFGRHETDGPRAITLANVEGLGGELEVGAESIDLRAVSAAAAAITAASWRVGRATLSLEGPAQATTVAADLRLAKSAARAAGAQAAVGSLSIDALTVGRLAVTVGERRTAFGVELSSIVFGADDQGVQHIQIAHAVLRELQARPGQSILRVPRLELRDVEIVIDSNGPRVTVGSVQVSRVTLNGGGLDVELGLVSLPAGITASRSGIEVPMISAAELAVDVEPVLRDSRDSRDSPGAERSPLPIDLAVLDLLAGHINVDLRVDVTLPVIGRRKATHRFRLGVESGTIDFKQLEGGLAGLEDAFIDFEVEGDTLVLERDIPLIPGDNKPILIWKLADAAEIELASRNRVRLRRLRSYQVAGANESKPKRKDAKVTKRESSVQLRSLALDNIDVALSMSPSRAAIAPEGAGQTLEGWLRRVSMAELTVKGALHHHPDADPTPSTLEIGGRDLDLSLAEIPLGDSHATANLVVAAIERVAIEFDGVRPRSMATRLAGVSLERIVVVLKA